MKNVGVAGLPGAGSSTIFTALTSLEGAAPGKSNQAVVPVPDERVDMLTTLHSSKKSVYATLRFVETSGMVRKGARGAGSLSAELLGHLRASDALLLVARAFGGADPATDVADLTVELVYADLDSVSAKAQRDAKAARTPDEKRAVSSLERARSILEAGTALREEAWDDVELAAFQGMALLTLKPVVVVANIDEDAAGKPLPEGMVPVAGALEAEVAGMDPAEASELLASFGLEERGLPRVIRAVYETLDLLTFLTAGDTESRAWEVRRGATAPEAAGVIHSDFQRGFIRAEVVSYDDLVAAGSWHSARTKGLVRQEGKSYVMREGDVVEFRFAV
jgi:GTP-binding protein YchF